MTDPLEHGLTITINQPWADQVGPAGVDAYVRALVDLAEGYDGEPAGEVEQRLRDRLDTDGVRLADPSYSRVAEQIAVAGNDLCVVGPDGAVLHGRLPHPRPHHSTADPEHPDRPRFS
ncbi:hypothetical protein [Luteipulveratus halotolerans]|nr:hypothetical protein [Luteipulveratus halotolerans]